VAERAKRVLVVGAGVVGLCTALYAARKGHEVAVLDDGASGSDGCSFGNSGLIVPSHFVPLAAPGTTRLALKWMWSRKSPFALHPRLDPELVGWGLRFWNAARSERVAAAAPVLRDLHLASRAAFEELDAGGALGMARRGLLMLCATAHGFDEEARAAEMARGLGLEARVLGAKEAAALEPALRLDVAGAVHFPADAHLDPARLMAWLRAEVQRLGVTVDAAAPVTGWRTRGARVEAARTAAGERSADEFVVCAGTWSGALVRDLGLRLPLLAGKGYSLTLTRPERLPSIPFILTEARVAVTPIAGALRFGGTMELGARDTRIDPRRVAGIVDSVPRYLPDFAKDAFAGTTPWSGLRPCSPDGLPYVGRFARFENLCAATGHAMMGLSLGPVTGRLVAEILTGEPTSIPIPALRPDRFA
jgi:D-amino-acid dehydrogenase